MYMIRIDGEVWIERVPCFDVAVHAPLSVLEGAEFLFGLVFVLFVVFGVFGHGSGSIEELDFVAEWDAIAAFVDGDEAFPQEGEVFVGDAACVGVFWGMDGSEVVEGFFGDLYAFEQEDVRDDVVQHCIDVAAFGLPVARGCVLGDEVVEFLGDEQDSSDVVDGEEGALVQLGVCHGFEDGVLSVVPRFADRDQFFFGRGFFTELFGFLDQEPLLAFWDAFGVECFDPVVGDADGHADAAVFVVDVGHVVLLYLYE
jgi:hypothetical protein